MAFTQKRIELVFTLGQSSGQNSTANTFNGSNGANQVRVAGLRTSCKITKTGGAELSRCDLKIFGLPANIYNALASIYPITTVMQNNTVQVFAGDTDPLASVFIGQITIAQIDLNQQPDSIMNIVAQTALLQAVQAAPPSVYPNPLDIPTALEKMVKAMGLVLNNNGVTGMLPPSTFNGTYRDQAIKLMESAISPKIKYCFDDKSLVIFPAGSNRQTTSQPEISAENGMIGYPSYSNIGIGLRTLYNPDIIWGQNVIVKSSLTIANLNGSWTVFNLSHELESEMPEGKWETQMQCYSQAAISSNNSTAT